MSFRYLKPSLKPKTQKSRRTANACLNMSGNVSSSSSDYENGLIAQLRSNAPSTRGQALERIIDLSFDHHVRDLLKVMGTAHLIELAHKDLFSWSDHDASLLSRSRTALVSVTDDMFMQEIKDFDSSYPKIFLDQASIVWTYARYVNTSSLSLTLCDVHVILNKNDRDPDHSFIVVRWVAQGGLCDVCPPAVPILDYMSVVVDTSPDWECVDQLLNWLLGLYNAGRMLDVYDSIATTLEMIIRLISYALSPSHWHSYLLLQ